MSHLKNPPAFKSFRLSQIAVSMALLAAVLVTSGCAMVQIPSYRLEECAAEEYSTAPTILPPLPMPGWLARWKADKDLPKPPESPRFHPLPTRPMFQPQPMPENFARNPVDAACYGQLPPAESWNGGQPIVVAQTPTLAISR